MKGMIDMRIYIEDNGSRVEVKEIETCSDKSNLLIFLMKSRMRKDDVEAIEKELTSKIGKQCVVLDGLFDKVLGV